MVVSFATAVTINNTDGPTAATTVTNASCGIGNGTLTLGAVTGGTVPYTYSVEGSAFTVTMVYAHLAAGDV